MLVTYLRKTSCRESRLVKPLPACIFGSTVIPQIFGVTGKVCATGLPRPMNRRSEVLARLGDGPDCSTVHRLWRGLGSETGGLGRTSQAT